MINIEEIEKDILNKEKETQSEQEHHSLAYILLMEVKASAKRWFIIAIAELIIIVAIVAGMIWYNSLPVEDITVENDEGNANYIGNDMNGEINNGQNPSD